MTAPAAVNEHGCCAVRIKGTDPVGLTCKACQHPQLLHPGITNPQEQECAMCHLLHLTRALEKEIPE